jgi:transcriptional repressor NrdR
LRKEIYGGSFAVACPKCGEGYSKVIDVRTRSSGESVRRRRKCLTCQTRYTTIEIRQEVLKIVEAIDNLWAVVETVELQLGELRDLAKKLDAEKLEGKAS